MRRATYGQSISVNGTPITYEVGAHSVVVCLHERRWNLDVDGERMTMSYDTQAEAWEAGVREAARRDDIRRAG